MTAQNDTVRGRLATTILSTVIGGIVAGVMLLTPMPVEWAVAEAEAGEEDASPVYIGLTVASRPSNVQRNPIAVSFAMMSRTCSASRVSSTTSRSAFLAGKPENAR